MRIEHAESGRLISDRAEKASTHWQRFRGLMLRRELEPGTALIIEPCSSIHMMFMRFRIDAIFYDKDGRIVSVARGLRPWLGVAVGGRGAKGVIEMRDGEAAGLGLGEHLMMSS